MCPRCGQCGCRARSLLLHVLKFAAVRNRTQSPQLPRRCAANGTSNPKCKGRCVCVCVCALHSTVLCVLHSTTQHALHSTEQFALCILHSMALCTQYYAQHIAFRTAHNFAMHSSVSSAALLFLFPSTMHTSTFTNISQHHAHPSSLCFLHTTALRTQQSAEQITFCTSRCVMHIITYQSAHNIDADEGPTLWSLLWDLCFALASC